MNETEKFVLIGAATVAVLYFVNQTAQGSSSGIAAAGSGVGTGAEFAGAGVGIAAVVAAVGLFLL